MIEFWILAAFMLLAAYALFVPALRGGARKGAVDRQKLNWLLHRQRREDLRLETGGDDGDALSAELDKDLLGDLTISEGASPKASPSGGRWPLILALLAAPLVSLLLYTQLGRPDLADFSAGPQAKTDRAPPEMQALIERLAERLKNAPEDPQGWMLLGRSYSETEQFDKAVEAFEQAVNRAPEDLTAQGMYAEALAQAAGGSYQGRPAEMAAAILAKDPQQRNALWVAAAAKAEQGDKSGAVSLLERLKAQFPANSEDARFLGGLIAKVQGRAADGPPVAENSGALASGGMAIRVKVSLSPALKAKAGAGDTVFIFARAAKGPPMPLAIARKTVADLPAEVALDDSMGMVQGMNLSAFPSLVIGARISKSGNALPAPGDLQGLNAPIQAENGKTYAVEIGEEVR